MNKKKISIFLIGLGSLNLIHGGLHLFQFLQSVLLLTNSFNENEHLEEILHNPILSLIWAIIGLSTLYIGIKDYKHHEKCEDD